MQIRIEVRGIDKAKALIQKVRKVPENIGRDGLREIGDAYVSAFQDQLMINKSAASKSLMESFKWFRIDDKSIAIRPMHIAGEFGFPDKYAMILETGARWVRPPIDYLRKWAEYKGISDEKARAIWYKFYHQGMPMQAHSYIYQALDRGRMYLKPILEKYSRIEK